MTGPGERTTGPGLKIVVRLSVPGNNKLNYKSMKHKNKKSQKSKNINLRIVVRFSVPGNEKIKRSSGQKVTGCAEITFIIVFKFKKKKTFFRNQKMF